MRVNLRKKNNALIIIFDNQAEVLQMIQDLTKGCAKLPLKDYPMGYLLPQEGCTLTLNQKAQAVHDVLHPKECGDQH